ncbi:hypothetical protein [uncultured Helicobacter sp.]|uniref:hypothetical protein n=1 Tax=uncultured Helicobacter sp. TaxID=175537 RepID=UPI0025984528|nr:hypothetical protein [uncultured Helicobacter sp.]
MKSFFCIVRIYNNQEKACSRKNQIQINTINIPKLQNITTQKKTKDSIRTRSALDSLYPKLSDEFIVDTLNPKVAQKSLLVQKPARATPFVGRGVWRDTQSNESTESKPTEPMKNPFDTTAQNTSLESALAHFEHHKVAGNVFEAFTIDLQHFEGALEALIGRNLSEQSNTKE